MSLIEFDVKCPGYLAGPATATVGLVIIQEWWGLTDQIKSTGDRAGSEGFRVLVPDLYRGKIAKNSEEAGHLSSNLDWPTAIGDITGAVAHLKKLGCKKVGVLGFCMGGALSIASAVRVPGVDAISAFYGIPDSKHFDVTTIKCPVQTHFGNQDKAKGFSDPETANQLEAKLKTTGIVLDFNRYDADHAFMNTTNAKYKKELDDIVWQKTINFFKQYLQ